MSRPRWPDSHQPPSRISRYDSSGDERFSYRDVRNPGRPWATRPARGSLTCRRSPTRVRLVASCRMSRGQRQKRAKNAVAPFAGPGAGPSDSQTLKKCSTNHGASVTSTPHRNHRARGERPPPPSWESLPPRLIYTRHNEEEM